MRLSFRHTKSCPCGNTKKFEFLYQTEDGGKFWLVYLCLVCRNQIIVPSTASTPS